MGVVGWVVEELVGEDLDNEKDWDSIPATNPSVPMKSWAQHLLEGMEANFPDNKYRIREISEE